MPRFPTRELAHAWAHQTASSGTCSANESFAGPDYYSYGTVIGKRLAPSTYLEGVVETSREVRVPVEDVERAYRFALAARARGWRRNGETCPVGSYQLDSIGDSGVIAGCHRIGWDEVERFGTLMGWAS